VKNISEKNNSWSVEFLASSQNTRGIPAKKSTLKKRGRALEHLKEGRGKEVKPKGPLFVSET